MNKIFTTLTLLSFLFTIKSYAQYSGNFTVQGDLTKFYPVTIQDAAWGSNKATEFDLGRSDVHGNASVRGSVIAKFRFHVFQWGHGSNFIDSDIKQHQNTLIGDVADGTFGNGDNVIIVWLRGGTTTYYWNSPVNIAPVVYDGVQHALPYVQGDGTQRTFITTPNSGLNTNGSFTTKNAFYMGPANNYFAGNVGIGTFTPDAKLTVNGTIHSTDVIVDNSITPDYVFEHDYKLLSLRQLKDYVAKNRHLPEVPSAQEVSEKGMKLVEMSNALLKKVEELTLYLIEKDKQLEAQQDRLKAVEDRLSKLEPQN